MISIPGSSHKGNIIFTFSLLLGVMFQMTGPTEELFFNHLLENSR